MPPRRSARRSGDDDANALNAGIDDADVGGGAASSSSPRRSRRLAITESGSAAGAGRSASAAAGNPSSSRQSGATSANEPSSDDLQAQVISLLNAGHIQPISVASAADTYLSDMIDYQTATGPPPEGSEAHTELLREFKRRAVLEAYRDNMEALMPSREEFEEDGQATGEDPTELERAYRDGLIPRMRELAEEIATMEVRRSELIGFASEETGQRLDEDTIFELLGYEDSADELIDEFLDDEDLEDEMNGLFYDIYDEEEDFYDEDEDDEEDEEDEDDYEDDDEHGHFSYIYDRRMLAGKPEDLFDQITEPIQAGLELRLGGDFGRVQRRPHHGDAIYLEAQRQLRQQQTLGSPPPSSRRATRESSSKTPPPPSTPRRSTRRKSSSTASADEDTRMLSRSAFESSRNLSSSINARKTSLRMTPKDLLGAYIPNSNGTEVVTYGSACYCGQYSDDSSFFYTCTQDFRVQMYDVNKAPLRDVEGPEHVSSRVRASRLYRNDYDGPRYSTLRLRRSISGRHCSWTITDANLSADNQWMIYSSFTPFVHLVPTTDVAKGTEGTGTGARSNPADDQQVMLDMSAIENGRRYSHGEGLFSVRFSGNSKEIIAGARGGSIYVYDIEARQRVLAVEGHRDDVNSVCFADVGSSNMLLSGSDDATVRIWDRRSLSQGKPAGILRGHRHGLTYVSPKGDGRYCVSNGKDNTCKLWDMRQMSSSVGSGSGPSSWYNSREDNSLMTFKGHAVCKTLIRCHFSPIATTGQSHIYSGSGDGRIHIWSLDGRTVQVLDRSLATPLKEDAHGVVQAEDPSAARGNVIPQTRARRLVSTVRDVSWHSSEPSLMSTSWEGASGDGGSIAKHEWKGLGKNGLTKLEDWVEKMRAEAYC